MRSLEFFIGGFLIGVLATLATGVYARRRDNDLPPQAIQPPLQGSATTNAPDQLAKIGHETGAEIFDD